MGVKNADGSVCYIIGVRKDIRSRIGKRPGDRVLVTVRERWIVNTFLDNFFKVVLPVLYRGLIS